ncbi:hypothetical protein Ahy_A01g001461 [Arachis hypogaea]|uniref:PB1-like domain-containing protein n=1 Tax=Arachis hypogaea TaxID=3818 RepID=A0A445ENM0_ARAHY|nr:hypothetical protein Ahy_A01g001461 [Arachis hypogaea]
MTDDLMCHEVATLESQNVGILGWLPNLGSIGEVEILALRKHQNQVSLHRSFPRASKTRGSAILKGSIGEAEILALRRHQNQVSLHRSFPLASETRGFAICEVSVNRTEKSIYVYSDCQMEEMLDIMFYHGGDLDVDTLDVFYLRNYHKKLGYDEIKQCWWQVPGKGLENGLRSLNNDKEIREMVKCAKINNGKKNSPRLTQPLPPNTKVASNTKGTQPPSTVSKNQNQTKKPIKLTGSIQPTKPIKTTQNTKTDKTNKSKQPNKNSISRRPCTRSAARGFQSKVFNNDIPFEVSSDSYESAEDSLFNPNLDEDSSSNSDTGVKNINSGSRSRVNKNQNEKILRNVGPLAKGKEKILVEDDAFVQEVSDEEVDLDFIGSFTEGVEYGLDPGADSDGANSWHSVTQRR